MRVVRILPYISNHIWQSRSSSEKRERTELPIERGYPIERVNEITEKEDWAKMN